MSIREQLVRAARGSLLLRGLSLVATLGGSVVLARALGPTDYGVYAFAFAVASLLLIPSQLGVPVLLVRETARADARGDLARLKGLWVWSSRVLLVASFLVAAIAGVVVWLTHGEVRRFHANAVLAGLALLPLISLGDARAAALRGLRLVVRGQLPEAIIRPALLTAFVGALWLARDHVSAVQAMLLHVVAAGLSFGVGAIILWAAQPTGLRTTRADFSASQHWRRSTPPLAILSGLQLVNQQAALILLGAYAPEAEAGVFKVALSASTLALIGPQTIGVVTSPYMAKLHESGSATNLNRLVSASTIAGCVMTLPIFAIFLFGGQALLRFLYGPTYVNSWVPLMIVIGGQVVSVGFGPTAALLNMSGYERSAANWFAMCTVANVAIGLVLIPKFGTLGAAWATVIPMAIWGVVSWHLVKVKLKVKADVAAAASVAFDDAVAYIRKLRNS